MKKIISAIIIFTAITFSINSQPVKEFTFIAGDTTLKWSVSDAKVLYFTLRDSSITGTDSIYIGLEYVYNGITFNSIISLHDLAQTTTTTFLSSGIVIPGDAGTKTYVWYPSGVSGGTAGYTGSIRVSRLNGVNASTPVVWKSRGILFYEN